MNSQQKRIIRQARAKGYNKELLRDYRNQRSFAATIVDMLQYEVRNDRHKYVPEKTQAQRDY